jgi:hypothetical protein
VVPAGILFLNKNEKNIQFANSFMSHFLAKNFSALTEEEMIK